MRLLLDTHALLWWFAGERGLAAVARNAIADERAVVHVSAASLWEIAIKSALGKLKVDGDELVTGIEADGFVELPIGARHAVAAGRLPPHHQDPFDRMLVAQAQVERLVVVTRDPAFSRYDVQTLPA